MTAVIVAMSTKLKLTVTYMNFLMRMYQAVGCTPALEEVRIYEGTVPIIYGYSFRILYR